MQNSKISSFYILLDTTYNLTINQFFSLYYFLNKNKFIIIFKISTLIKRAILDYR